MGVVKGNRLYRTKLEKRSKPFRGMAIRRLRDLMPRNQYNGAGRRPTLSARQVPKPPRKDMAHAFPLFWEFDQGVRIVHLWKRLRPQPQIINIKKDIQNKTGAKKNRFPKKLKSSQAAGIHPAFWVAYRDQQFNKMIQFHKPSFRTALDSSILFDNERDILFFENFQALNFFLKKYSNKALKEVLKQTNITCLAVGSNLKEDGIYSTYGTTTCQNHYLRLRSVSADFRFRYQFWDLAVKTLPSLEQVYLVVADETISNPLNMDIEHGVEALFAWKERNDLPIPCFHGRKMPNFMMITREELEWLWG